MLKSRRFDVLGISGGDSFAVFILLLNTFAWYYITLIVINGFLKSFNLTGAEALTIWVTYYVAVVASSVVGSILSSIRRLTFIYAWMILGTASSLLVALPNLAPQVWSFALGVSLGVGMPACLGYFADHSTVENRGRIGGIIFFTFYLSVAFFGIAFTLFDLTVGSILFAIWRGAGLLLFILLKPKENINTEKNNSVSFTAALKDKSLRLYLLPWIMFSLIDSFEARVLDSYLRSPSVESVVILWPVIGSFSAVLAGLLSDRIGRKKLVISGFVALGLAYAVLGIAPDMLISWYFYTAVEGIAWGIFFIMFVLIIWGDLSRFGGREKYYVIGGTPYFLTRVFESFLTSYIVQIPAYATFSLASFFLFLAVLPLLYAPETLPEKKIELIRVKGYIEQAKKIREKYAGK